MDAGVVDGILEPAAADGSLPGTVAMAGDGDGTVYEGAYGLLRVDGDAPVQPDTVFWLASMTKPIVSIAALQLLERGQIELEQPVADILPEFGRLQVLEGFDGDVPRLRPPNAQATIRQLLTHTSGVGYWFSNPDLFRYHELTGTPDPSTGKLASLYDVPLVVDPGVRWEYGMSTDWLGLVVEAVSGQDLEAVCAEKIFGPLGMSDTTFRPTAAQFARMQTVHARRPDGALVPSPLPPAQPEYLSAGSGASGTAGDYLRFLRALLRDGELDGERVLAPETVRMAFTDHLRGEPIPKVMRSAMPELTNDVPGWPVAQGWGLGFHLVLEDLPAMRRAGTGDWAGLANCFFWIDRSTGVAAVLMTAVLPFFDAGVVDTVLGFEQAVYEQIGLPAAA